MTLTDFVATYNGDPGYRVVFQSFSKAGEFYTLIVLLDGEMEAFQGIDFDVCHDAMLSRLRDIGESDLAASYRAREEQEE